MRRELASKMVSTKQRLCKVEDLPDHLQFNKDILSGYRRPMNGMDCVRSWWNYLHNESFNCYSHGRLNNYVYCIVRLIAVDCAK